MAVFPDTRLLGSALILAGTSIGAGMLALPLVSAAIGFFSSVLAFSAVAFFMVICALFIYEANLVIGKGSSMYVMAGTVFGRSGKAIATVATLGLFYALLAAYLSGGGELVHQAAQQLIDVDIAEQWGIVCFALITGAVVFYSTKAVDYINRILFLLMLIAFWAVLIILVPHINYQYLSVESSSCSAMWLALPIIFTSFGYHGSISSIILYQRNNTRLLPIAFFLGTCLVLAIYIAWLMTSLGNLSVTDLESLDSISDLMSHLSVVTKHGVDLNNLLFLFSNFALATSVLGVALGVFDYLASVFQRTDSWRGRMQTVLLTFIPPVCFAFAYPKGFVIALGYAAIALSVLAVLLPVCIVWVLRGRSEPREFTVFGGKPMLLLCFCFGAVVIGAQLMVVLSP